MVRTTKRKLKEDKLLSTTAEITIFLNKYWKRIVIVAAGVVILASIIVLYNMYTTRKNENATRILDEGRKLFNEAEAAMGKDGKVQATIEKYENAKAKFDEAAREGKKDYTVSQAMFYSAKCSYQLGRYDEAIPIFQKVMDKHPKSLFAPYAQKGIAYSYEQLGGDENLRKAIQQYEKLSQYPESFITLYAYIDRGRCYEKLREWDQAITVYKIIVDRFKVNLESAIQAKSLTCVQKAKEVISKYQAALGKDQSDLDFAKLVSEKESQKQWFEALKMYDKAIFSKKEYWGQQRASEAANALSEYEKLSGDLIRNISTGRDYEKQGDLDSALRYYIRVVDFNFLPGLDMFDEAQLRIDWIGSVGKLDSGQQSVISSQPA